MFFTIIIPVKDINDYVRENVAHIMKLNMADWEVYILPNNEEPNQWDDSRINVVATGRVSPGKKRDTGARLAKGDALVFLDDDSYPDPRLLDTAKKFLQDEGVVAIGGPGVTPPNDTLLQRVSGAVFLSKLSGGFPERYVSIGKPREVEEWPSVNLIVRREAFIEVGGFDSDFWPGEDSAMCSKLRQISGCKVLYVPEMLVWHHRRLGFWAHVKQIGAYGLHRGYLARIGSTSSQKLFYFVPSAFFVFACLSFFARLYGPEVNIVFLLGWMAYALALIKAWIDIRKWESLLVSSLAVAYIFPTHLSYGFNFIRGVLTRKLKSKLR